MDPLSAATAVIARDDPARPKVAAVIAAHLAQLREQSPAALLMALPPEALHAPDIRFYSLTLGEVVGIGAIRLLPGAAGELKSMHVRAAHRGRGLGEALVRHLVAEAQALGLSMLYLETGAGATHAPARRLYARLGFAGCGPFGDYADDPQSAFMAMPLA